MREHRDTFASMWFAMTKEEQAKWRKMVDLMLKDWATEPEQGLDFKLLDTTYDIHVDIVETDE